VIPLGCCQYRTQRRKRRGQIDIAVITRIGMRPRSLDFERVDEGIRLGIAFAFGRVGVDVDVGLWRRGGEGLIRSSSSSSRGGRRNAVGWIRWGCGFGLPWLTPLLV
jgi:hypothetical protein